MPTTFQFRGWTVTIRKGDIYYVATLTSPTGETTIRPAANSREIALQDAVKYIKAQPRLAVSA
jgi:hypothetical protein